MSEEVENPIQEDAEPRRKPSRDRKTVMRRIIRNESKAGDCSLVIFHLTKPVGKIEHMVRMIATEDQMNRLFRDVKNRRPWHITEKILYENGGDMIPVKIVHRISRAYRCSILVRGAIRKSCPLCKFMEAGGNPTDFRVVEEEYDEAKAKPGYSHFTNLSDNAPQSRGAITEAPDGFDFSEIKPRF